MSGRGTAEQARLRTDAALKLIDAGFTRENIAKALGCSYHMIGVYLRNAGVSNKHLNHGDTERAKEILELYKQGFSQEEIGQRYGVTRARIQQVLAKQGLARIDRGLSSKEAAAVERKKAARIAMANHWDAKTQIHYGCSASALNEINNGVPRSRANSPAHIYINQKKNAVKRGIEWVMSLPEWWALWQESGKWEQRGRGKGRYCMARLGDSGGYSVDNVEIITCEQNVSDSYLAFPAAQRWEKSISRAKNALDFSPRQAQVAALMDEGKNYVQIALALGINSKNAWQHVNNVSKKRALLHEKILRDSERQCPSSLLASVEAPL